MAGENFSDNVFVDWDLERQGHLLSNSEKAPGGIALFGLDTASMSSLDGPLARACAFVLMRRAGDTFDSSEFGGGSRESKVSVRLLNGSGGRVE